MRRSNSVVAAAMAAFCATWMGSANPVAAEDQPAEAPAGGTVLGILTAKGESWIEVKADGAAEADRYLPFWRGGAPKDGGGFDKDMLKTIAGLRVPGRVELVWKMEEHRRIVTVKALEPQTKEGTVQGTVAAKGETWIEGKPADGPAERYTPRWTGGMPKDGGGRDKAMLEAIAKLKVGDKVTLKWMFDERKRVVAIE